MSSVITQVLELVKKLLRGETVVLPDQVPPQGQGVWAPFFGKPAYTMTLSTRLARQSGALLVLAWGERLSWGRGYRIHLRRWPSDVAPEPQAAAGQVNAAMEALIRECPDQYLWGYARYKAPPAEQSVAMKA